jgi:hypothetical protein
MMNNGWGDGKQQTLNNGGTMTMTTTTNDTPPTPALMSHCPWGGSQVGQQGMDNERQQQPMTDDGGSASTSNIMYELMLGG